MQPFCPTCRIPYSGSACPACGSRAALVNESVPSPELPVVMLPSVPQSVPARVVAGSIVALGIVGGFREFFAGSFGDEWVRSEAAIAAAMGIRALAGGFAGLLAGAGRDKSAPIGLMTGAIAASIWTAILLYVFKQPFRTVDTFGFVVLMLLAAGGASLGSRVWPPKAELPKTRRVSRGSSIADQVHSEEVAAKKIPPTQWARIILAVSLTICAFVAAPLIRDWMAQGHFMDFGGSRAIPFACIQIAIFAMILSSLIAGAGTGIGLRQGVYTGLIAGAICASIYFVRGPQRIPAGAGLVELMNWSVDKATIQQASGAIFGTAFVICTVGGAFGSLVIPPLSRRKLKKATKPF